MQTDEEKGKYEEMADILAENGYVSEAVEMLGRGYNTDPVRTEFISVMSGFTPVPDVIVKELGYVTALVWGRVWRYCQMSDGVCRAALDKIASSVGMSERTIIRHLEVLCGGGYLYDTTPDLKNKPHIYADTGKVRIRVNVEAGVTESQRAMTQSQRQGDRESVEESIKKQVKKSLSKEAPDFENMSIHQAYKLPTLRMYRDATRFFPGQAVWKFVHEFILENNITKASLKSAYEAWRRKGFNQENVEGILEWARDGIPGVRQGGTTTRKPSTSSQTPAVFEGTQRFLQRHEGENNNG